MTRASSTGVFWGAVLLVAVQAGLTPAARGAAGDLDPTFAGDGTTTTTLSLSTDIAGFFGVAVQPDGKIVQSGYATTGSKFSFAVVRYNPNGTLDTTFDGDGKVVTSAGAADDIAAGLVVQPDGKIVVCGAAVASGGNYDVAVVRYNPNGSLDTAFDGDGKVLTPVGTGSAFGNGVALQPDGKIVVSGFATGADNTRDFIVVRYHADGSLDTTFDGDGRAQTAVGSGTDLGLDVAIQADGRIVVVGEATSGSTSSVAVVRFRTDGSLDSSFDHDGRALAAVGPHRGTGNSVAIQPDGRIIVIGSSRNGDSEDIALLRYNVDGSLDATFDGDGIAVSGLSDGDDSAFDAVLQPDGKIVVVGLGCFSDCGGLAARFTASGALDPTFGSGGRVAVWFHPRAFSEFFGAALTPDGRIVASGYADVGTHYDVAMARLLSGAICGDRAVHDWEQCDDGALANGDCCSASCQYEAPGAPCPSDGLSCSADACDATGTCRHDPIAAGTPCRPAAGLCDLAERCDGVTTTCPADAFATAGVCRTAAGPCDAAEQCNGSGAACPTDGFLSGGTCRAAAGICDLAEACDGAGISCPPDAKSAAPCRAAADLCDRGEACDGVGNHCPTDTLAPLGTICRAAAGDCDLAETCNGSGVTCPADSRRPDGTTCTDADTCTMVDTCQGGVCTGDDPRDCDDGNPCSTDACDPLGGCINDDSPARDCRTAARSLLLIRQAADATRDRLLWKWSKGSAVAATDLANPTSSAGYALCLYAGPDAAPIASAALPPGPGWRPLGSTGYSFKGSTPHGLSTALLKSGTAGRAKALARGQGSALPDPILPLAYPVTVQLRRTGSPLCLESTFTAVDERANTEAQFKAKQ